MERDRLEASAADAARLIDALMAQPVKASPAVIVLGDDAVTGFTPAPSPAPGPDEG